MRKVLIANRGEIALRVIKTARQMGIATVAVYSEADRGHPHTRAANESYCVGPAAASESYLNQERLLQIAKQAQVDCIHPGYGFLAENPDFVERVAAAGITFIGPSASAMRALGNKDSARALAEAAGVPVVPGYHGKEQSFKALQREAKRVGLPLMLKARAGGGGKGMRIVHKLPELKDAIDGAQREATAFFGDAGLLIERLVTGARHIEVQLLADNHGTILHLFERECSLQRRHQKVIEETPAPHLPAKLREKLFEAAKAVAQAAKLTSAATVEFLVQTEPKQGESPFYFLEVNCRIQVEHPVTELVCGLDLVELQFRVARAERLEISQADIVSSGAAIEARVYAELPAMQFLPSTGRISALEMPANDAGTRVDHALEEGLAVTTDYDPMLAKVSVHAKSREQALQMLAGALERMRIEGVESNLRFLKSVLDSEAAQSGLMDITLIDRRLDELVATYDSDDSIQRALAVYLVSKFARLSECSASGNPFSQIGGPLPSSSSGELWQTLYGPLIPYEIRSVSSGKSFVLEARVAKVSLPTKSQAAFEIEIDGELLAAIVRLDLRQVEILGTTYNLPAPSAQATPGTRILICDQSFVVQPKRSGLAAGDSDLEQQSAIASPLPGTIIQIHVAAGDSVTTGETLCVVESMKMEHSLVAEHDAVVKEVLLSAGQTVQESQTILVFEGA